jgi:hypothetical protein
MSKSPLVVVVVLNYNGRHHLETCFDALLSLDYPQHAVQLLFVDNGSTDGSVESMRKTFPQIQVIQNERNLGFAAGNNVGIRWAIERGAQYVGLVNNDTRVDPGWLQALVSTAENNADAALCGGRIVSWDGSLLEFSGTVFYKETSAGGYTDETDRGQYNTVAAAGYACGASMLIRTSAVRKIGLFDEDFFCYHEDVDLSLRAWIAGYRVLYVPQSIVYHRRGGSSEGTAFRDYIGMRNALTTVLKCYEVRTWRETCRPVLQTYLHRSPPHLKRAFLHNMVWLPRTLRKRRAIQRARQRSDAEMFAQFPHIRISDGRHVWPQNTSKKAPHGQSLAVETVQHP